MNKKLGLAVAGAVLALSSAAQAGITIPAGDWTVDISGNVNAFYINNTSKDTNTINGGLANKEANNNNSSSSINTGLLPSWLTIAAKTRQNDLDVTWAISFQPGASQKHLWAVAVVLNSVKLTSHLVMHPGVLLRLVKT